MPIFRRIEDPHMVYEEAFGDLLVDGRSPTVVTSRFKSFTSSSYTMRVLLSGLSAVGLVFDIYAARARGGTVFVREFWNIPLLLTAVLVWPMAGSVLFNINHNLSNLRAGVPTSIQCLAGMGFRFVLFDGGSFASQLPKRLRQAFCTPLFPSVAAVRPRTAARPPYRIGLVGSIASIAGESERFFDQLSRIAMGGDVELCYGRRGEVPAQIELIPSVRIVDTGSRSDFTAYLHSLDIAIFVATKRDYFYRHSGTVMDAVSAGVVPIVPDFPVLASQVTKPVPVGLPYETIDELPDLVRRALSELARLSGNRVDWHAARAHSAIMLSADASAISRLS